MYERLVHVKGALHQFSICLLVVGGDTQPGKQMGEGRLEGFLSESMCHIFSHRLVSGKRDKTLG